MQRPSVQIAILSTSVLLLAAAPLGAGAQVVAGLVVPGLSSGVEQRAPAAAFDGTNHLLVWDEEGVVWGVVLGAGGSVVAAPFPVASPAEPAASQAAPAVAAAGSGGGFLVVWTEASALADLNVRGARVASDGGVVDSAGFDVSSAAGPQERPAVAASGSEFLVVWQDGRDAAGAPDVYGTIVAGGVASPPSGIPIASGEGAQRSPAVAASGTEYLVAWEHDPGAGADVHGARVAAGTGLPSAAFPISAAAGDQLRPSVASSGAGWAVVWADGRSGAAWPLVAARVDGSGVVAADAGGVQVAAGDVTARPAIASDGAGYLVAFERGGAALAARFGGGGAAGAELTIEATAVVSPGQALAFSSLGRYLAVHRTADALGTPLLSAWLVTTLDPLDVQRGGTGSGTVASSPAGIDCGATCSAAFETGTPVTLTATPAPGSIVDGWTGCGSASGDTCTVTVFGPVSVTAAFLAEPGAPGGPSYEDVGATSLTVSWSPAEGATAHELERALETGGVVGGYGLVVAVAGTTHVDGPLAPNATYWYRVRGTNGAGAGAYGSETSVTTLPGVAGTPTFSSLGSGSVTVSWSAPEGGAEGYELERATSAGTDWAPVATVPAPGHTDATVAPGTAYLYRVRATNVTGAGAYSAAGSVTTLPLPPEVPAAPTYTAVSATSVTVEWAAVAGATSYDLERAPSDAGPFTLVAGGLAGTSRVDGTLAANGTWWYRVRASNAGGDSAFSAASSVTTLPAAPGAPSFDAVLTTSVTVSWTAPEGGAGTYELERADDASGSPGAFAAVGPALAAVTYADTGLTGGTRYWYRVRARTPAGAGAYSTASPVTTVPAAPLAPACSNVGSGSVRVSWAPVTGATGYALDRAPAAGAVPGTWAQVATSAGTTVDDAGLASNATYWYRVRATNGSGDGAWSGESSVLTLPGAAGKPAFGAVTATSATVSWTEPAGGAATYSVERAPAAAGPWTVLTSGLAALTFTDPTLAAGTTYWYRVLASNAAGPGAPSEPASVATLPGAPAAPGFTGVTASSLTVSWLPVAGATGYVLERAPFPTGPWAPVSSDPAALTFSDSGLAAGTTYSYRVLASNDSGPGAYSATASIATLPAAPDAPAFANVTASTLTVSWPPVTGATGYVLERAPAAGAVPGTWAQVATPGGTIFDDGGLASNATYWYRVRATNASGGGAWSGERSVVTAVAAPGLPAFTAVDTTRVTVSWAAPSGGADSYSVERALAGTGAWTEIASALTSLSFADTGLEAGTTYSYRVLARTVSSSAYSATASVATLPAAPGAPGFTNVAATTLTVSWNPVTGATSYKVERAPDVTGAPGAWTQIAGGITGTSRDDTGRVGDTTYWYRVRATNASGDGPYSPHASVLTLPGAPGTPSLGAFTTSSLTVSWTAPAGGADSYSVERALAGTGIWTEVAPALASLSFADGGLAAGTTYSYRVRATNLAGTGLYSAIASAPTLPDAPGALTFPAVAASSLTVAWPPVTGATSYRIERAPDAGGAAGTWVELPSVTTATFADSSLAPNSTYWYRVRARNASGDGAYSAEAEILTVPGVPGTPSFTAVTDTSVTVSWAAPTGGADSYDLERATSALGPWTRLASAATSLAYDDAALDPGVRYWYRVRGVNATGAGLWSTTSSITALPDSSGAPWFTGVSTVSLTVNWSPTAGATTYHVERAPDAGGAPGAWVPVATGLADPYFNDAVAPNTTYWYRVRGANSTGYGGWSPPSSVTALASESGAAPTFTNVTDTSLTVSWAAPAGGAASYVVERATSALGPWVAVASGLTALSHDDLALSPATTYWYRVRATNATGETGAPSPISAVATLPARPADAPGAPTFGSVGPSSVAIAWTAAAGATSYQLERAPDAGGVPGAWQQLASPAIRSHTDASVAPNAAYWYRVRGVSAGGAGPYSGESRVVTLPNAPGAPTFGAVTTTTVALSWLAPAGGATTYVVERSTSARPWAPVVTGLGATTFTDTGLDPATGYFYRVRGANVLGQPGAASSAAPITTSGESAPPGTAGRPTYSGVSATALTISWTPATGAESYALDRAPDAGGAAGAWTQVATTTAATHRDTGRAPNTVYWYRVRATSATGTTVSAASSVTTAPDVPGAPALAPESATAVLVSWTAPAGGAATYKVERAASAIGPWTQVGAGIPATSHRDASLAGNTTYHYRVRATNAAGVDGLPSASRSVTTPADTGAPLPGAPGAPTYSSVTATYARVSWAAASDAVSYVLERAAASSGPWTQVAATVATSVTDSGRTANTTYWYRVRGTNGRGDGPNSPSSSVTTAPNAPGAPTFAAIGATTVTVSWTAPAGGAASYKLERATSVVGPWTAAASGITTLSRVDSGLTGYTTYYYRVRATTSTGVDGASSPSRSVLTAASATAVPGPPGAPTYSSITATSLRVSWAPATGATGYALERAAASTGPWTQVAVTGATSLSDMGRTPNTAYWYRVRGTNGGGAGLPSAATRAVTAPNAPGAPTFSSVRATTLTVSWTAPAGGAASYRLERATSAVGPWTAVGGIASTTYADAGLAPYTTYWYRVRGTSSTGVDGAASASSPVLTAADATAVPGPPGVPTYSSVTATTAKVSWAAAPGATSYELERAGASGSWTRVTTTTATTFTDGGRTANTRYWYRVRGSNGGGYGGYSPDSSVTTAPNAPGAPEATAVTSSTVTLSWAAPLGGAASYALERASSAVGPWTAVASGLGAQTWTDSGLAGFTTYYYRVRGTNSAGVDGLASYTAVITTEPDLVTTLPGVPGTPEFSNVNATWVKVSWAAAANATAYVLERATAFDGPWTAVATTATTSFSDTGRTANTRYWYRVVGANGGGRGPYSGAASVLTAPGTPGAPTFSAIESTGVTVGWTAPGTGAASYRVERATTSIGPWVEIAPAVPGLAHTDSGLTPGTAYYYRVRATNGDGLDGAYSLVRSVTTAPPPGA